MGLLMGNVGMKPTKKRQKTEWYIQKDCISWFRATVKHAIIFSVPNEAAHSHCQYFESIGMLAGVSDTIVVSPDIVLFVEFKSKDGRMRPQQLKFQTKVEEYGYRYYICRSLEEFKEIMNECGIK